MVIDSGAACADATASCAVIAALAAKATMTARRHLLNMRSLPSARGSRLLDGVVMGKNATLGGWRRAMRAFLENGRTLAVRR
jgi:hypothetical protein